MDWRGQMAVGEGHSGDAYGRQLGGKVRVHFKESASNGRSVL